MVRDFHDPAAPLIEPATTFLSVEFLLKNDQLSNGVLTHTTVTFLFNRGGGVYARVALQSLALELTKKTMGILGIWVLTLLYLSLTQVATIVMAAHRGLLKSTMLR